MADVISRTSSNKSRPSHKIQSSEYKSVTNLTENSKEGYNQAFLRSSTIIVEVDHKCDQLAKNSKYNILIIENNNLMKLMHYINSDVNLEVIKEDPKFLTWINVDVDAEHQITDQNLQGDKVISKSKDRLLKEKLIKIFVHKTNNIANTINKLSSDNTDLQSKSSCHSKKDAVKIESSYKLKQNDVGEKSEDTSKGKGTLTDSEKMK